MLNPDPSISDDHPGQASAEERSVDEIVERLPQLFFPSPRDGPSLLAQDEEKTAREKIPIEEDDRNAQDLSDLVYMTQLLGTSWPHTGLSGAALTRRFVDMILDRSWHFLPREYLGHLAYLPLAKKWELVQDHELERGAGKGTCIVTLEQISKDSVSDRYVKEFERFSSVRLPLLNHAEGDTLVYTLPSSFDDDWRQGSNQELPFRMRSDRFLATGSTFFRDLLSPTKQYRIVRRLKCLPLPPGIKYVLDLRPPNEGDIAVELTTQLSCSWGLRQWYAAAARWNVHRSLVCGTDDDRESETMRCRSSSAADSSVSTGLAGDPAKVLPTPPGHVCPSEAHDQLPRALLIEYIFEHDRLLKKHMKRDNTVRLGSELQDDSHLEEAVDYTTGRHISGIARVLHAIEGLDPRIDSALKLWTVFVVAVFFDCTSAVVDWVISWIYAPANCKFIEVLPEVSSRLAIGLRNYDLCRDAFAILVGEEALESMHRASSLTPRRYTLQRRRKEDLEEDFQTRVEYASKAFSERINATFDSLIEPEMSWLEANTEYRRMLPFTTAASSERGPSDPIISAATKLIDLLKRYVRGRILGILAHPYEEPKITKANTAVAATDLITDTAVEDLYRGLGMDERLFTRTFWRDLARERWSVDASSYLAHHPDTASSRYPVRHFPAAVSLHDLVSTMNHFNVTRASTCDVTGPTATPTNFRGYNGKGKEPEISGGEVQGELMYDRSDFRYSAFETLVAERETSKGGSSSTGKQGMPPSYEEATANRIRGKAMDFDMTRFMRQVRVYVRRVCLEMLRTNLSFEPDLTDMLLCLTDDELKFLPLWAGGDDDGSGGVFDPAIPNAEAGPNGPGPRLHTGDDSVTASEYSFISSRAQASYFDSSLGVEDGHSDHVDRRRVASAASEDSSWSEVMSDKVEQAEGINTAMTDAPQSTGEASARQAADVCDEDDGLDVDFEGSDGEMFDSSDDWDDDGRSDSTEMVVL
ncbi:MAG: hypothetical protein M1817_005424 [Caeruleum heppii]|nr:MAG: hypothetical protein M1817_005424 [Caeruleum heppii]